MDDPYETPDKWDDDMDDPFCPDGLHDAEAPWRGLEHPAEWPEDKAASEYWLYLKDLQDEDDEDA